MKNNIISLYISIFSIFSLFSIQSFAQISCNAKAPAQVGVGESFQYSITVNDRNGKIQTVNFPSFKVIRNATQSTSSSVSFTNGKMTKSESITYTYILAAEKEGTFTIPPVVVNVSGKTAKSNPVTIKVSKSSGQSTQQGGRGRQQAGTNFNKNDVFVKAYCSSTNPYVGEQIVVTYKLYIGRNVNGGYQVNDIDLPKQSDLWAYEFETPEPNNRPPIENIDGKQYSVIEIKKTALFPQKTGEIIITPMALDMIVRVISSTGDPFYDNFFGGGRAQDYNLDIRSNSIKLNVKALPEHGKPDNFSGVVGNFNIKALLSRDELSTNDATNLSITISGTGNLQYIDNLNLQFPPDFDVSDPTITDNINKKGSSVTGSRIFEYVLIPRSPGKFSLPAATFSYFDIKSKSYKTLQTEEFNIKVKKGDGDGGTTISSNQKDIQILSKDIHFIKTSKTHLTPKGAPFFDSWKYYLIFFSPILLSFIFIVIRRKQIEYQSNASLVKNKRAHKVAKKNLKSAKLLLQQNKKEEFYIEISRALWGYLSDKYHIPLSQLSIDTVEKTLIDKQLGTDTIENFIKTLNQCEFARFAPGDSSQMMQEMYERATHFILTVENLNR